MHTVVASCSLNAQTITEATLLIIFLKKSKIKNAIALQVIGDKGSENKLIEKHMVMLRATKHKRHIDGKSAHNTGIELFLEGTQF